MDGAPIFRPLRRQTLQITNAPSKPGCAEAPQQAPVFGANRPRYGQNMNHLPGKQDHNSKFAQRKTRRRNYPQWIHWEQLFGLRRIYFLTGQMSMASASAGIKKRYEMGVINPRLKVSPVSASAKTEVTGLVETSYALYTPCPYQHSHADEHLKCWSCKLPALACCKCLRKTTMAHVFLLITGMENKKTSRLGR